MTDFGRALHARLVDGDPVATAELAERYLDPLTQQIGRAYPHLDDDLHAEAAERALLALFRNPGSYDPERSSLEGYLFLSAKGDLLNLLRTQVRHRNPGVGLRVVALEDEDREIVADDDPRNDPATALEREEDEQLPIWIQVLTADWTQQERQCLDLMQENERRTTRYAEVLCIPHLTPAEQRAEVKRMKDRLARRIQRAAGRGHVVED